MQEYKTAYDINLTILQREYADSHIGKYIKEIQEDNSIEYFEEYVDWLVDIILNKFNIDHTTDMSFHIFLLDVTYNDLFLKESKDNVTSLYYEDFVLWLEERISIL